MIQERQKTFIVTDLQIPRLFIYINYTLVAYLDKKLMKSESHKIIKSMLHGLCDTL